MPATSYHRIISFLLRHASLVLLAIIFAAFGALSAKFLEVQNLLNILIQSSSVAIVAVGMTFVLLVAGIDLSVGSIMFLSAVIAGKMVLAGYPTALAGAAIIATGLLFGLVNAFFITRLRLLAFIVTLSTLYAGRGVGLYISQTRAMNLPGSIVELGSAKLFGVPLPVVVLFVVLAVAHLTLTRTAFGRQIYAVGHSQEAATKAGIKTKRILLAVYLISGLCAAIGGIVALTQLGAVSPTFGNQREFLAIAAAVLGGTSLFGGRGSVFPGTVLGAVLIQTVENGLVIINADPYVYPLVIAAIIFVAVLIGRMKDEG